MPRKHAGKKAESTNLEKNVWALTYMNPVDT